MVCDLQIAQDRRDGGGQSRDERLLFDQMCIWCDVIDHVRKDGADFAEVLRSNMVYLWNGRVHACDTRRPLEVNTGRGDMKRIMEKARHDMSRPSITRPQLPSVWAEKGTSTPVVLEGFSGKKLKKEEVAGAEKRV